MLKEEVIGAGAAFHYPPGTVHRVTAIEDTTILEVSTPQLDDVVRLEGRLRPRRHLRARAETSPTAGCGSRRFVRHWRPSVARDPVRVTRPELCDGDAYGPPGPVRPHATFTHVW